jgi:AraC-like DNA-binding protein
MNHAAGITAPGLAIWHGRPVRRPGTPRRDGLEILFVERGLVDLQVAAATVRLPSGGLAAYWGLASHEVRAAEAGTSVYGVTVPIPDFLQWQLPRRFTQELLEGKVVTEESAAAPMDRALFLKWLKDAGDDSPECRRIFMLELEARLRRLARSAGPPPKAGEAVATAELDHAMVMGRFIAEHYTEVLHDAEIAQAAHLNVQYASRLFSRAFGVSMHRHVNDYRIAHARRLLATTRSKVIDVALESGFGSLSRFYESFARTCGQCPNEYRAALLRGESA